MSALTLKADIRTIEDRVSACALDLVWGARNGDYGICRPEASKARRLAVDSAVAGFNNCDDESVRPPVGAGGP